MTESISKFSRKHLVKMFAYLQYKDGNFTNQFINFMCQALLKEENPNRIIDDQGIRIFYQIMGEMI